MMLAGRETIRERWLWENGVKESASRTDQKKDIGDGMRMITNIDSGKTS